MSLMVKDPQARIDHAMDWSGDLGGQSVVASEWHVSPAEPGALLIEAAGFEPGRTRVRVSGGAVGQVYRLTNRVTLSDGQVEERSVTVRVEEG